MAKEEQAVDPREEAVERVRAAEDDGAHGESMAAGTALAQVHATLAVAEELRGINRWLEVLEETIRATR